MRSSGDVKSEQYDPVRPGWLRRVGLVVFLGALVAVVIWQLRIMTGGEKIYESSAVLRVAVPSHLANEQAKASFLQQQMDAMLSDQVLRPVVNDLRLDSEWSLEPAQAVTILRGRTEVAQLESSQAGARFSITVRAPGNELTRAIAAKVASEYRQQGNAKARRQLEQKVRAALAEIEAQQRLVQEKERIMKSFEEEGAVEAENQTLHSESRDGRG